MQNTLRLFVMIIFFLSVPMASFSQTMTVEERNTRREIAYAGTDPSITLSNPSHRPDRNHYNGSMTLMFVNGVPTESYREILIDGRYYADLAFVCVGNALIEVTSLYQFTTLSDAVPMNPNSELAIFIAKGNEILLPAEYAGSVESNFVPYVRLKAIVHVDSLSGVIGDTTNLNVFMRENGKPTSYRSDGAIEGFLDHIYPLFMECQSPRPVDQPLFPVGD